MILYYVSCALMIVAMVFYYVANRMTISANKHLDDAILYYKEAQKLHDDSTMNFNECLTILEKAKRINGVEVKE